MAAKKNPYAALAAKPPKPIGTRNTGGRIEEDDPRWNWKTMGNNMRGPHGQRRNYRPR